MKSKSAAVGNAKPLVAPPVRLLFFAAGVILLALAALAAHTSYISASFGKVFFRLPGMGYGQFYFFSVWWAILLLPAALVLLGLLVPAFRAALRAPWREPRVALPLAAGLAFFIVTMIPAEFPTTPAIDTGTALIFHLVLAGTGFALFLAGAYSRLRFLDRPMERIENAVISLDRRVFILLLFGFAFLVNNLVSYFVFGHMPHVSDSIAQFFQARIFASGRLYLESPRFPDFFDYNHIINNGQWYSQYPFMHSFLLMFGVLIGAPWVINPLLGALTVALVYILGRDLYSERTGRFAGVLAALSPFIFNMSAEFMNHASSLLFAVVFLIFFFRAADIPRARARHASFLCPLFAGIALGLVANVRPYNALAYGLPFAAFGLVLVVRDPRRYLARFLIMAGAAVAVASLSFVYNRLTNGDPFLWGYVVKWGPGHEIGFGKSGWGEAHTPWRGLVGTLNTLNLVNKFFYEWPIPSSIPIVILLSLGTRDRRDWLLFAGFLSLVIAYFFYWFQNACFGPRVLYEAAAGFILLTVRGAQELRLWLKKVAGVQVTSAATATLVRRTWPVLFLLMLTVSLPPVFRVYNFYGGVRNDLKRAVRRAGLKNAVVFCRHLGQGLSANSLGLDGDVVYAKDYGICNSALTLAYPGRTYYYGSMDTLRRLDGIEYRGSRLEMTLGELNAYLVEAMDKSYRTVIWPFDGIPPVGLDSGPRVIDPRRLSREVFRGEKQFDDFLPAIACWIVNDTREHLKILSYMNDLQNVLAGGYKFTLLAVTPGGYGAVYDISTATGREATVPDPNDSR